MADPADSKKKPGINWTIWYDDSTSSWRLSCSICTRKINRALVFPTLGLRVCFSCLGKMHQAATEAPSGREAAGPASDSVPGLSRGDTPEEV